MVINMKDIIQFASCEDLSLLCTSRNSFIKSKIKPLSSEIKTKQGFGVYSLEVDALPTEYKNWK